MDWLRDWWEYRKLKLHLWWLEFQLAVERENLRQERLRLLRRR